MYQDPLFPVHTASIIIQATWDDISGWHLAVASRLDGARWPDNAWTHYDHLSAAEMVDVVAQETLKRA